MLPTRITTLHLGVHDVAKMRAFYNALGWTEANPNNQHFAEYKSGGAWLSLFPHDLLAKDATITSPPASGYRGLSIGCNVNDRDDVDRALAAARDAGGRIVKEAVDTNWGGRSGYFEDPEGNLWEVAWSPKSQFDERGGLVP